MHSELSQTERVSIVEEARSYLGTPYRHQGRLPGVGLDCAGMLMCVAKAKGLEYHNNVAYSARADGITLKNEFLQNLDEIEVDTARPADVYLFWIRDPNIPQHVALITEMPPDYATERMIHCHAIIAGASSKQSRVKEHGVDSFWRKRIHSAFRFRKLSWHQ